MLGAAAALAAVAVMGGSAYIYFFSGLRTSPTQLGACASCGTVNPPDSRFCGKCGKKL